MADPIWVLDTSIAASWFFADDPAHRASLLVRAHLKDVPNSYVVPHLFHSEIVHVLARKSGRRAPFVRTAMDLLIRLGLRTLPLSREALVRTADWACRGMGGDDATFVALAEDLGGRWLTADERAARMARTRASSLTAWVREHRS